jgi:glycosyltransferase involved in cell wall biosynthesis
MRATKSRSLAKPNTTLSRPIRVLEVVFLMGRGGIESYLRNIIRHVDRQKFQVDLLVHIVEDADHPYIQELKSLGCRIIVCPDPRQCLFTPWLYIRKFKHLLREYGPYDIIHSHAAPIDGAVLNLAQAADVPIRIVTCHNPPPVKQLHDHKSGLESFLRRFYHTLSNLWIKQYATLGLGVSKSSTAYMFGSKWHQDARWQVLCCGIDLKPFYNNVVDANALRAALGIPKDAFVVGNVGRFNRQKNHSFLVEIASEVIRREQDVYFLLIGEGELRSEIEDRINQLGLGRHFIFAGLRSDVPQLMLGAMDAFLMPSLFEGLGLVLVEAQAAGLPCIFTHSLPDEVDNVDYLIRRLDLLEGAEVWAEAIVHLKKTMPRRNSNAALELLKDSPFNVEVAANKLFEIYEHQVEAIQLDLLKQST